MINIWTVQFVSILWVCFLFGTLIWHLIRPYLDEKSIIAYSVFSVWLPMVIISFIFQLEIPWYFDFVGAWVVAMNSWIWTEILREWGIKKIFNKEKWSK